MLVERGDLGTPGQEWSCGEPGVACEGLNLVESRREGNEADCCFWLEMKKENRPSGRKSLPDAEKQQSLTSRKA